MHEQIEQWRIEAEKWLDLQKAADLLRGTKNDVFAEMTSKMDGSSEAEKQRLARVSPEWKAFRDSVVEAEAKARQAKMLSKYADMKVWAANSENANARKERGQYQA
tara:strand:- start:531 stop:848 length:318 start_codon:yes stop_codon:yes gene_type:complete